MRATAAFAWIVFTVVAAWSAWYFAARWWPAQCWEDGCMERDAPGSAGVRSAMWLVALALGALAAASFAVVVLTLGELFPPRRPPFYGE